jgi:hypothetical protein
MIGNVFVSAKDSHGQPAVAETFRFNHLPRIGEHVFVTSGQQQYLLEVILVRHFPRGLTEELSPSEDAFVSCTVIEITSV